MYAANADKTAANGLSVSVASIIWKTKPFSLNERFANGELKGPTGAGFTANASWLRIPATTAEKLGTNGTDPSRTGINISVTNAAIAPGSGVLTPCATEYASGPGTTNAASPF